MRRAAGTAFGVATHVLFVFTVWHLFRFLKGESAHATPGPLWIDTCLALQFAVPHSVLLHPVIRERLTRWIPRHFYGLVHCTVTCLSLLTVIFFWRTSEVVVWDAQGWGRGLTLAAFYGSWLALFYSLHLSGLGYQTGWTPWWYWLRSSPLPPRKFEPRSLYLWLRHPIYMSFLGLIWFNPMLTSDRLLLAALWSVYIFVGSHLKDRRLLHYLGGTYRAYQTRVPGYPFIPAGPLARVREMPAPG